MTERSLDSCFLLSALIGALADEGASLCKTLFRAIDRPRVCMALAQVS
jgi:hypothetical protein